MPEFLNMLILAVVQGLTEFLPVSSSGHLVLLQHFLGTREGDVFFDVVLHGGTLFSILAVYRRELVRLLKLDSDSLRYILALGLATVPAVVVGLLAQDTIDRLFGAPRLASLGLIFTGLVLLSTRLVHGAGGGDAGEWKPRPVAPLQALLIGCAQALAICPGISRSGSTIAASLWLGLPRTEATRFSFLMAIPAIAGAVVLNLVKGGGADSVGGGFLLAAAVVSFGVGLLAIRLTALAVVRAHFWKFSFYCLAVGAVAWIVLS
ncbi:hypothetical protein CO151_03555 [bacterium CG_4_9_14_3_um_filter_65_15]|nr:MAG: hypothetical protein CO151_03555 [bacterium CG_4_9_14_3_um_filter_65_15]